MFSNTKLIEMFREIANFTDTYSGVTVDTGAKKETVHSVSARCQQLVKVLMENESTQFLVAPVLEHYFNLIRPAIMIPFDELLANNTDKLDLCTEFHKLLKTHPVRKQWTHAAENFRAIAESAGYTFEKSDYKDLATIAPIIANAITSLEGYKGKQRYKVRSGARSGNAPVLMDNVSIFPSVAMAVETLETYAPQAFIGFFGVQETYKDTSHNFDEWLFGYSSRKKNIMSHEKLSEDTYNNTLDINSRAIYCIIRDGANIWLVKPPVNQSGMECMNGKATFTNFYGQRASYAPLQIFWDEAPACIESTAIVPYKQRTWSLREIMDEDQKVWLPIYFATIKSFFFGEEEPESLAGVINGETCVELKLTDGVQQNLPALVHEVITLPTPEELFSHDTPIDRNYMGAMDDKSYVSIRYRNALEMMRWLGIRPDDIKDAPFEFKGLMSTQEAKAEMERQMVQAYYKVIAQRLSEVWDITAYKAQEEYHTWVYRNVDNIIARALNGEISYKFYEDKVPLFNDDGTPKMRPVGFNGKKVQEYLRTDNDDGKQLKLWGEYPRHEYRDWFPATLIDKHPPTTFHIKPTCAEDIARLVQCTVEELPDGIRYMDKVIAYQDKYYRNDVHPGFNGNITLIFSKTEAKKRGLLQK